METQFSERGTPTVDSDIFAVIIKSNLYHLDGHWVLGNEVFGNVNSVFGLPVTFDLLINIQGQNYLIYPDDNEKFNSLIGAFENQPVEFSFRVISSAGEIKLLSGTVKLRKNPGEGHSSQFEPLNSATPTSELDEYKELLESVIQSDITALSVLKPIRDSNFKILDFEWVIANNLLKAIARGQKVVGKRYSEVFSDFVANGNLALLKQVVITGERAVNEFYHRDNNIQAWFRGVYVKLNDLVIASFEDITDSRKAQLELKESRSRLLRNLQVLQQTEAVAGIGSWEYIIDTQQFTWSDGMYRIFDVPEDFAISPEIYLQYAINDDLQIAGQIVHLLTNNPAPFTEVVRISCNGKEKTLKIKAEVIYDEEKKPAKILGVDFDITALTESEKLKELNVKLNEVARAKAEFFSNVSHEFRTPLTLTLGPLDDIIKNEAKELGSTHFQKLKMIHRNAMRLQKLVNNLLDFSRIEAGGLEVVFQPTDLSRYTMDIASGFRSIIENAGLKLVTKSNDIEEPIYINRPLWEKIVLNLISNAFKFTHEGKIEVTLKSKKRHVQLHVKDTGIGISSANQSHIFQRFKRIEGVKARTYEGSGIGLALVQELVHMHGGTLKLKSTEGEGSEFIVCVPKGKSHLPGKQIFETTNQLPGEDLQGSFFEEAIGWLPESKRKLAAKRRIVNATMPIVLLADDNSDMRQYLENILSDYFKVIAVETGKKVVEFIEHGFKPDLILADVMMPEMDGHTMVTVLKNHPGSANIPIVLLSARSGEADKIQGMQFGADDYIVKPFSSQELLAIVNARIQISKIRNDNEAALRNKNLELEERVQVRTRELSEARILVENQNVHLHIILDAIPQMIIVLDSEGKIKYLNDRWYIYTGLTEEQCIDLDPDCCGIFHASQLKEIEAQWKECRHHIRKFVGEALIRNKSGEYRWHLNIIEPILSAQNKLEMWVGTFTDVHEQFLSEKIANENRDLLEAVFNSSTNAISVLRAILNESNEVIDFGWTLVNRKMELYANGNNLIGRRLSHEYPMYPDILEKLRIVFLSGKSEEFEHLVKHGKNQYCHHFTVVRLEDSVIVSQQNITEKVQAKKRLEKFNESLRQKNYELKSMNDELTNFAFIASHDLREPLRKIQLYATTLAESESGPLPARARDYPQKILRSVSRMNALIEDILSFSRIGHGPRIKFVEIDLNELLRDVLNDLSPFIQENNGKVEYDVLPALKGNALQISQLFQNLISNGIKFHNPGTSPVVKIESRFINGKEIGSPLANPNCRYLEVAFIDNGIGFEERYAEKIFQMFQRLNIRSEFSGTGMGLAICKRVVENHKGFIVAHGTPQLGSKFTCYFSTQH